jgi:DNA-directed RNA polymerase subunit M/transcription elongation factor TFIIS
MNYQLIYDNLISKAKERSAVVGEYTERHHIVPKATMSERNAWKSPWTEEKRIAQSERLKGKPQRKKPLTEVKREHLRIEKSKKVTCPHCGKVGQMMVMPRWHFDNCKLKPGSEPASTGKELSHD